MTQEDKKLLLKDICARLPYGVIVKQDDGFSQRVGKIISIYTDSIGTTVHLDTLRHIGFPIEDVKLYLRPLSDMTEEEQEDYFNICDEDIETLSEAMDAPDIITSDRGRVRGYVVHKELEWLYEHHFDFIKKVGDEYKTLTELGLAIEAPENMYNNQKLKP